MLSDSEDYGTLTSAKPHITLLTLDSNYFFNSVCRTSTELEPEGSNWPMTAVFYFRVCNFFPGNTGPTQESTWAR
jgi:hypothetical protein